MRTLIGYFLRVFEESGNYKDFLDDYKQRMKKRYSKEELDGVIKDMEKVLEELRCSWL